MQKLAEVLFKKISPLCYPWLWLLGIMYDIDLELKYIVICEVVGDSELQKRKFVIGRDI